jgi:hypothetical protein
MPPRLAPALALLAPLGVLAASGPEARAAQPPKDEDCLGCHADRDLARSAPRAGRPASVFVDAAVLRGSTHGGLECVACHMTATAPHGERLPAVRCAGCHDDVPARLAGSAHGRRTTAGPQPACAACHGTHDVRAWPPRDGSTASRPNPRPGGCATSRGWSGSARRRSGSSRSG